MRCNQSGKDLQMSVQNEQAGSVGTDAHDYDRSYYHSYGGVDEPYDWDSPHWRTFFTMVAERVKAITNPSSVLDVGCARGLLVQAFCEQGVDDTGSTCHNTRSKRPTPMSPPVCPSDLPNTLKAPGT